jgi:hypothetical protein
VATTRVARVKIAATMEENMLGERMRKTRRVEGREEEAVGLVGSRRTEDR